jgi:hypothetical protein
VNPLDGAIGLPRAIHALEFGLNIRTAGFNLFVTGFPGSGRLGTVLDHLTQVAALPVRLGLRVQLWPCPYPVP